MLVDDDDIIMKILVDEPETSQDKEHDDEDIDRVEIGNINEDQVMEQFIEGEIDLEECLRQILRDVPVELSAPRIKSLTTFSDKNDGSSGSVSINKKPTKPLPKPKKKKVRKSTVLDPALSGMIGEANLQFARGNKEQAFKLCLEVIRLQPEASQPFHTLFDLYEDIGDKDSALKMKFMAALVGSADVEEWLRLSEAFKSKGDLQQAIRCISRAINTEELNLSLYMKRYALYMVMGNEKYAVKNFSRILYKLGFDKSDQILQVCEIVGGYYLKNKEYKEARKALHHMVTKCSKDKLQITHCLWYIQALMGLEDYKTCAKFICNFYNGELEICNNEVVKFIITEDVDHDLFFYLIICMIKLGCYSFVKTRLQHFYENNDIECVANGSYDVAKVYMEEQKYEEALSILQLLQNTQTYGKDQSMWRNIAVCYQHIGDTNACIESYYNVIKLPPDSADDKVALCQQLRKCQRYADALDVSSLAGVVNADLMYEKCLICLELGKEDEFLKSGWELLKFHARIVTSQEEVLNVQNDLKKVKVYKKRYVMAGVGSAPDGDNVPVGEEWAIVSKMCKILKDRKEYETLRQLIFSLYSARRFQHRKKDIDLAAIYSNICCKDYERGYDLLRTFFLHKGVRNNRIWNLLNFLSSKTVCKKAGRFLLRCNPRKAQTYPFWLLRANYYLHCKSYRKAMKVYIRLFNATRDPFIALLVAVTATRLACQKKTTNRFALVSQAMAFLNEYENNRGLCFRQEIFYNIGRAFHQMGVFTNATFFYKKALETPPVFLDSDKCLNLAPYAAFNLSLIYKRIGNTHLSEYYVQKYIVI